MDRKTVSSAFILLSLIFGILPCLWAEAFEAEVTRVDQGDLLTVRQQGKEIEVSLYGVTCPSPGQALGNEARQFASRKVLNEKVRIQVRGRESESRVKGSVQLADGSLLGHDLVRAGLAAWDRKAAPNDIKLQTLEDFARKLGLGLWASSPPEVSRAPIQQEPQREGPPGSKPLPWAPILSTILALFVVAAMVVFFGFQTGKRRGKGAYTPLPVQEKPADETQPPKEREEVEAVESGRRAIEDLLQSLSEFVSGLLETNVSYDSRMKDHKSSIDQAMTMAGLEQIKHLLTREIEEMQSTSENYRRQLEEANATIRDQQEILERFRIDAKMDFLTKIPNRRAFESRLNEELERAKRYRSVFTLVMIDIDHFKKVNDVYGHTAGDQILRLVAQVLEDERRFNDFVSRYGGEEFALLLPESTGEQGRYVADKIRRAVEKTSLLYANAKIKVTISAGVGEVDREADTPETFVGRVDAALYRAKENGRNRVELACLSD